MVTSGQMGHTRKRYEVLLKKNHLMRHVILTVPTFSAAAVAVVRTNYVAGIPRRVAKANCWNDSTSLIDAHSRAERREDRDACSLQLSLFGQSIGEKFFQLRLQFFWPLLHQPVSGVSQYD